MHPAMTTLPGASSPPAATPNLADHAIVAGEPGSADPSRPCHRRKIRQLNAVTRLPSRPPPPLGGASPAGAQPKRLSRSEREDAAKITQPCSECGKRFWSWKALFGHMRCHPDRPWRGIEPPPDCPRRGPDRAAPPADPASAEDEDGVTDAEVEAATSLILLKGEHSQPEGSGSDELASPAQASGRFMCSSCGKVFDTGNGLGGHRAGHARWARDMVAARKRKNMAEEGVHLHKCGVCSMSFSSGQALGGHMSSHWKGESQLRVAAAAAAAEPASSFTSTASRCPFDLNLPAEEEREDVSFPAAFAIEPDLNLLPHGLHRGATSLSAEP